FRYQPGSATFTVAGVTLDTLDNPTVTTSAGVRVEQNISPCIDGTHAATASIKAEGGTVLGATTASAQLELYGATTNVTDAHPVTVVANPSPTAMGASADSTLYLGHVGSSGAQDRYT